MPAPKTPRAALYCNVISDKLVIVKMPARFVRASVWSAALLRALKLHLGLKRSEVYNVEGLAGYTGELTEHDRAQDLADRPKFDAAFAGDPERFSKFHLFAWNDETEAFDYYRKPTA